MDGAPWTEAAASLPGMIVLGLLLLYAVAVEPGWGVRFFAAMRRVTEDEPDRRPRWFARLVAIQSAALLICLALVWLLPDLTGSSVGLRAPALSPLAGGILLGAGVGLVVGTVLSLRSGRVEGIGDFEVLLPRSPGERAWLVAVAAGAGTSEELLYRGVLPALAVGAGAPVAAAFVGQALVFGLAHRYQGWAGVAATGALGLVLGALVVLTGSVLPAVLLHFAIDLRLPLAPTRREV